MLDITHPHFDRWLGAMTGRPSTIGRRYNRWQRLRMVERWREEIARNQRPLREIGRLGRRLGLRRAGRKILRGAHPIGYSWDPTKTKLVRRKHWWQQMLYGPKRVPIGHKAISKSFGPGPVRMPRVSYRRPLYRRYPRVSTGVGTRSQVPLLKQGGLLKRRGTKRRRGVNNSSAAFSKPYIGPKVYGASYVRKHGVCIEEDEALLHSGARTFYFGHYTHPHKAVINSLFFSLAKLIGRKCAGDVPSTIEKAIGEDTLLSVNDFVIEFVYLLLEESETAQTLSTTITGGSTYKLIGEKLRHLWFDIVGTDGTSTNDRKLEHISIRPLDKDTGAPTTTYTNVRPFTMSAKDITVTIYGSSALKYQNVTLGETTAPTNDRHSIQANPLEGRVYFGKGSHFRLKHWNQTANASDGNLVVGSNTGQNGFASTYPTSGYVDRMLQPPPSHKMWHGLSYSRYIRMQPGVVSKSFLKKSHTLPIRKWLSIYRRQFGAADISATASLSQPTSIGVSRHFGVDKMIHDSDDPNTRIHVEVHLFVGAVCNYKKSYQMTATFPDVDEVVP